MLTISEIRRANGFRILSAPDAGGGSGSPSAKKTDLEQLTEANGRITALEGEKVSLSADLVTANNSISALQGEKADLTAKLSASDAKVVALEADKVTLTADVATAKAATLKAEGELKTADERADLRLREIDAKNGGTLPPKDVQGGGAPGAPQEEANTTPRQRLAAGFKVAGE